MILDPWLQPLPLIPILRGLRPEEAIAVGEALVAEGMRILEVPLNSPEPLRSITALAHHFGPRALVGAGTVTSVAEADAVAQVGGSLIVMPHVDCAVIGKAKRLGLLTLPGVATPTEAFSALGAGADGLKLFPAELILPPVVKALLAVLPPGTRLFPVGGIEPGGMAAYRAVGVAGFGIGGAIFRPGMTPAEVGQRARAFRAAWEAG